jgi:hypothetical protein
MASMENGGGTGEGATVRTPTGAPGTGETHERPAKAPRRGRRAAVIIVAVLVAAAIAACAFWGVSLSDSVGRISTYSAIAENAASSLSDDVSDLNVTALDSDARTISDQVDAMGRELGSWEWDVAARLPFSKVDVQVARTLVDVCERLSDEALLPVTADIRAVKEDISAGTGASGSADVAGLVDAAKDLSDLYDALDNARTVTSDCQTQLDAAPQAGNATLAAAVSQVSDVIDRVNDAFDQVAPAMDAIDALTSGASASADAGAGADAGEGGGSQADAGAASSTGNGAADAVRSRLLDAVGGAVESAVRRAA